MKKRDASAICNAIAAAVFYALNVPCSKLLLDHVAPTYMAAFLYLGAGIGVGIMYLYHHRHEEPAERLSKKDMPYTFGMILLDILAPILLASKFKGVKYYSKVETNSVVIIDDAFEAFKFHYTDKTFIINTTIRLN